MPPSNRIKIRVSDHARRRAISRLGVEREDAVKALVLSFRGSRKLGLKRAQHVPTYEWHHFYTDLSHQTRKGMTFRQQHMFVNLLHWKDYHVPVVMIVAIKGSVSTIITVWTFRKEEP